MKKISHLLAQDERRPKPPITLSRLTAADDAARSRDEVLAIPADRRRARVESGDLKIYKRPRKQRYTDVSAALVTETPERGNDEKKATQKTTRWQPKGTTTSADDNEWFEALAMAEIERLPTRAWGNMLVFWRLLPSVWPSTQKRLLVHMLKEAAKRGDPLPAEVVKHMAQVFAVSPKARGRIHETGALLAAARYRAENPNASWSDLARAAGLKSKQARHVVRQWGKNAEFLRWVKEFNKRPRAEVTINAAYIELAAKAAELRKTQPHLSEAQAFAKVYTDPANRGLVKRERDLAHAAMRAGVCQKKV